MFIQKKAFRSVKDAFQLLMLNLNPSTLGTQLKSNKILNYFTEKNNCINRKVYLSNIGASKENSLNCIYIWLRNNQGVRTNSLAS
mgnify:FL=1